MSLPLVDVLGLGGTITMTPARHGVAPSLAAHDLVEAVPGLDHVARLRAETIASVPSAGLTWRHLWDLSRRVTRALEEDADGVIVVQGTDTMEESAYFLDLTVPGPGPVVVTGAMRHPGQAGADGPANLLAAVRVAASPAARHCGVLVVMDDHIHRADQVRKVRTFGPMAFASPGGGPVGTVVEGRVLLTARPGARQVVPGVGEEALVRTSVGVLPVGIADDGRMLRAAADAGFDGVVLEALGAGHVPEWLMPDLRELAGRMPVVLASRTGSGRVFSGTYGYAGSETDLLSAGLISAGSRDARKARVLLTVLLAAGMDHAEIVGRFTTPS